MHQRERFSFLLMGQGGSGKTAIVQEVVLPTMDFVFPPEDNGQKSSLIVCSSWAQAENISTNEHRAMSCHKAAGMRVQKLRNRDMLPGEKKPFLEQMWLPRRLLVLEEVGMISPALYNMLLYRSFHGRTHKYEVPESHYDKLQGAFGRIPLVIHLGDFLQLRPTSAFSLLDNFSTMVTDKDVPAEHQMAATLFMQTPLCFELVTTNRFKDARLRRLMEFMRTPGRKIPGDIAEYWQLIQGKHDDPRFYEERFIFGHKLAIYWETVSPWMMQRARQDAAIFRKPLYLLQAADTSTPALTRDMAAKLMNAYNPQETGHMHGLLALHEGMQVRLLVALDKDRGLVREAEGVVA